MLSGLLEAMSFGSKSGACRACGSPVKEASGGVLTPHGRLINRARAHSPLGSGRAFHPPEADWERATSSTASRRAAAGDEPVTAIASELRSGLRHSYTGGSRHPNRGLPTRGSFSSSTGMWASPGGALAHSASSNDGTHFSASGGAPAPSGPQHRLRNSVADSTLTQSVWRRKAGESVNSGGFNLALPVLLNDIFLFRRFQHHCSVGERGNKMTMESHRFLKFVVRCGLL